MDTSFQEIIDLSNRVGAAYGEHRSGAIYLSPKEREIVYFSALAAKESLSKEYYQLLISMIKTADENDGETQVPESNVGIMFALGAGLGTAYKQKEEQDEGKRS